jgi:hypothetical protein
MERMAARITRVRLPTWVRLAPARRAPRPRADATVPVPTLPARSVELSRLELSGAIALVQSGVATSVVLCGIDSPEDAIEALTPTAVAAGVGLHGERTETGSVDVVVRRH